jgi:hypothetical protein
VKAEKSKDKIGSTDTRSAIVHSYLKFRAIGRTPPQLTLLDIAKDAGVGLEHFHGVRSVLGLDDWVEAHFDALSATGFEHIADDPKREVLFDVIMRRFEAMEVDRVGVVAIDQDNAGPLGLARGGVFAARTARWMLLCAGIDTEGPKGAISTLRLARILMQARRAWQLETSSDFSRTMAALDRGLRDAEDELARFSDTVSRFGNRFRAGGASQPEAPPPENSAE